MHLDVNNQADPPNGDAAPGSSPGGEQMIPKSRFDEVIAEKNSLKEQVQRLSNQSGPSLGVAAANGVSPQKQSQQNEKVYTRQELENAAAQGIINDDQIDVILDSQRDRKAELAAHKAVETSKRAERIDAELLRYKAVKPEAWEEGTSQRESVKRKYNQLLADGRDPTDPLLELDAIRSTFGDIDALETAASSGNRGLGSHEETGGDGDYSPSGPDNDGLPKMSSREKAFYKSQIDKGVYSDWKAVAEELKYRNTSLSKRAAAR